MILSVTYGKKYDCEHVLLQVIDAWKTALDENKFAGTVLMDHSKAFHCVPHGLLIAKFKAYGLTNEACEFMSSYLSGRYQEVRLSNEKVLVKHSLNVFLVDLDWCLLSLILSCIMLFILYKYVILLIMQIMILFQR